jgi:tyrosyl-tRNA synthetase
VNSKRGLAATRPVYRSPFTVYAFRMSSLLQLYTNRGFFQDATPGLAARLAQGPITAYIGFDPTADSLHVGSLVPVMGLAWLQRSGGTPIALIGAAIRAQLSRFLRFRDPNDDDLNENRNDARMLNNADWLRALGLMEFLRDTGKHFTLSYMMQKESVKSRMETGISYTEFSYMLVQAYDFWHLYKTERCELQMGGSDQWGNITAGIELVSRREQREVHGLVFPLITAASGAKFGKSEGENVWLDPARTSPYRFYQFWLNTDDRDVERYLKLFTFLELDRIAQVAAEQSVNPAARPGQRSLAWEVTVLVHGQEEADKARQASEALFGRRSGPVAHSANTDALLVIAESNEIPVVTIGAAEFGDKMPLVEILARARLASSKADARRNIQGGGIYVNGEQVDDVNRWITLDDFAGRSWVLLRKGKKNYVKLVRQ